MPGEVVEDGLPAFPLLFLGMRGLAVERDGDQYAFRPSGELDESHPVPERVCGTTRVYSPAKSNPNDPSLASMRDENLPPGRRSTEDAVVCQSGDAVFQTMMSSGVV